MGFWDEDFNNFEKKQKDQNQKDSSFIDPYLWGEQTNIGFEKYKNSFIRIDTSMETNPEFPIINGWASIISMNEGAQTIGYLYFKIYNCYFLKPPELLSVASGFSEEEYRMIYTFSGHFQNELDEYYLKFILVNEISLNEEYQHKGIELKTLIELINLCRILDIDYVLLKDFPLLEKKYFEQSQHNKQSVKLAFFQNKLVFDVFYLKDEQPVIVLDIGHI